MNEVGFMKKATGLIVAAVAVLTAATATEVRAQSSNTIFPEGWDKSVRDRMFMRLGYTSVHTKTDSGDAKDVTGPVVTKQQLSDAFDEGQRLSVICDNDPADPECNEYFNDGNGGESFRLAKDNILTSLNALGYDGLGTPVGVKAKAQKMIGTPTVSLGYWLDEERTWLLEAFVLAMPMSVKIYGEGSNQLNGRHIASTKLLPPLVVGSYHFLKPTAAVRPYVGVGATYAIFFDSKTTSVLDRYQGGKTSLSVKNAVGVGPFVGLAADITDRWHFNLSVGQVELKAKSTLVTSNTHIYSGADVLKDYPASISSAIAFADKNSGTSGLSRFFSRQTTPEGNRNGMTTAVMYLAAQQKNGSLDGNQGTFVRRLDQTLTNTIMTMSLGYKF